MKKLAFTAILAALLVTSIFLLACGKNEETTDFSASTCGKVIISVDGDETEYKFGSDGRLLELFGVATTPFYNTGKWQFNVGTAKFNLIDKDRFIYDIKEGGDGLETILTFVGDKVVGTTVIGFESGKIATTANESYAPKGGSNVNNIANYTEIDEEKVTQGTVDITYTGHKSPFAGHKFQAIIEQEWTPAGHTNDNLAQSESYTIKNTDPDIKSVTTGKKTYSYTFDDKKRLTKIIITDSSVQKITNSNGQTSEIPKTESHIITLSYQC